VKRAVPIVALIVAACVTACAAPPAGAPLPAVSAGAPAPVGVQNPMPFTSADAGAATPTCDNARRSYRPQGPLPAPEQMPDGTTMARIAARGRLVVGVDQNTYLFGFRDPNSGDIVGFDIDIAREVARAIFGDPGRIQLVAISYADRIPKVSDGTVDMVADTMTVNCDRWTKVNFSTVYFDAGQRVLVPRDSTVSGIGDLGRKRVCAAKGSTSLQNVQNASSQPIPVGVEDWTDCLVMLQQGQVDAISTDDTILAGLAAQDPFTKIVGAPFTSEPYGLAIAQANVDFVRFVNGVLQHLRDAGGWSAIHQRWLGSPGTPPAAEYRD
jgi:polar amino acid transport system substrate-binding protein